ncbi:MAG TPA: hypothetical protein VF645_14365 [Allosphingosinicella sp.]
MTALDGLRRAAHLALAALIACAGGAVILAVLLTMGRLAARIEAGLAGGPFEVALDSIPALAVAVVAGGLAIGPALSAGWLPAFASGALLAWLGRDRAWARGRPAWSAAGAAVALACYFRISPAGEPAPSLFELFGLPERALPIAFLLAGAAAGQVYRSALAATAPFFGLDEETGEG